jgi:hypothetical protein
MNMNRGAAAGRMSGAPVQILNGPRVTSAAMMAEPVILDPAEQERLDAAARAIGILPPAEEESGYTREEAEAQGAPVREDTSRMTAREVVALGGMHIPPIVEHLDSPRLPDFTKMQGIDLMRKVAYVDMFEVELPDKLVNDLKGEILHLAVELVTRKLADAMMQLNPPTEETSKLEVQSEGEKPTAKQAVPEVPESKTT